MNFSKMQGTGNDFILIDGITQNINPDKLQELSPQLCDRHFGVGADGVILALASKTSDIQMRIFNADGSEAEMCGNGLRCLSLFAFNRGLVQKKHFAIQTLAGVIKPEILEIDNTNARVKVNMGRPEFQSKEPEKLDLLIPTNQEAINFIDRSFFFMPVSMGNPHAVIQVPSTEDFAVQEIGPLIENHSRFPEKTNVEFIEILSETELKMRVWERGSGETLACGTGACATVVAGVLLGKLTNSVTVHLSGGDLMIEWPKQKDVFLTGNARFVFEGEIKA